MNSKTFLSTFIALFLLVSLASGLTISSPSTLTLSQNTTSVSISNNMAGTQNVTLALSNIVDGSNQVVLAISPSSIMNLAPSTSQSVAIQATSFVGTFKFGTYSSTLTALGYDSNNTLVSSQNATVSFTKSFCKSGPAGGNLSISQVKINSDGDEDTTWKPLDKVTVEVTIDNDGDNDIKEVTVELGIFDSAGKNKVGDVDFVNSDEETITLGTINDGKDDTATFEFIVPADFDDGSYDLTVKAYSDKTGESKECTDSSDDLENDISESVSVEKQSDEGKYIAFDNIELSPTEATCGDTVTLVADAFNVGEDDQDQVKVYLKNKELNLDTAVEIKDDLNTGDNAQVTFSFVVPQGAKDKTYSLALSSAYDYNRGNYRQSSDDDQLVSLTVLGCSSTNTGTQKIASISATLGSDAKAGSALTVNSRITNTGSSPATFVVSGSGYDSWADLTDISERILSLNAGESKDVTFSFDVADDASGSNSFVIEVQSGDKQETRTVSVAVQDKSGFSLQGNSMIWIIGAVNVILIILIIVVAISISRR